MPYYPALVSPVNGERICCIVYGAARVTQSDIVLVQELRRRGFAVWVLLKDDPPHSSLATRIRLRIERLFFAPLPTLDVRTLPADRWLTDAPELPPSSLVIDFSAHPAADALSVALDGRVETLHMASIDAGKDRNYDLTILRGSRVVQRSEIVSNHAWRLLDQAAASKRAVALLLRAIDHPASEEAASGDRAASGIVASLTATAGAVGSGILRRATRRWSRPDAWFLAYWTDRAAEPRYLFGGRERFLADPCAVRRGNETFVFCEDYPYRTERGVISVSSLRADGMLSPPITVLERSYHLSYPFVFQSEGNWWMVPESSENRTVDLYRAIEFPFRWELHATLLDNLTAVDATLHYDGRWWMFLNIGDCDSSTWDELSIYLADELAGPWRPHPRNPVKCSPRAARPAGALFRDGDALIRPAQDCSTIYGGGVRFCRIDTLTENEFAETELEFVAPSIIPGATGLHTWTAAGDLHVVDARFPMMPLDPRRFERRLKTERRRARMQ